MPATTSRNRQCDSSCGMGTEGVSTLRVPMTSRPCRGSSAGPSTGTQMKARFSCSSSERPKALFRNAGWSLMRGTMTGWPVENTCPVTPTPGSYSTWSALVGVCDRLSFRVRVSGSKMTMCGRWKSWFSASVRSSDFRVD